MKDRKGFTLIELVIVIVLLSIVSLYITPKLVNLRGEAETATVHGMAGAIESLSDTVYLKLKLMGKEKEKHFYSGFGTKPIKLDWCDYCQFAYGYPMEPSTLEKLIVGFDGWQVFGTKIDTLGGESVISMNITTKSILESISGDSGLVDDRCYVTYSVFLDSISAPNITVKDC